MPLYEYECPKDGTFEQIHKFSDPPLKACPTCGGPIEKLASAPAIQFKGTGWYVTDYAKKSGGGEKESKEGGASKETGSSASSSSSEGKGTDKTSDRKGSDPKGSERKSSDRKGSSASAPGRSDSKK